MPEVLQNKHRELNAIDTMFVTFDGAMLLTLLVVLYSTLVRSQAPGDAHDRSCTMQPVADDVVMLLDSAWYRSLLPSNVYDSAGWTQTPAGSVSRQYRRMSCFVSYSAHVYSYMLLFVFLVEGQREPLLSYGEELQQ